MSSKPSSFCTLSHFLGSRQAAWEIEKMRENILSSLDYSFCSFSLFNLVVVLQGQEECKGVLLIITPGPRHQLWMEPPQRAPAPPLQQQEDLKSLLLQGPSVRANRWLSAPWQLRCPPGMARLGPQQCKL